jgi:hypothetical protein
MPRRRVELPPIDDLRTWRAAMVTVQQLADYWQFHPFTITKWLRTGELEGTRFKGGWRIKTDVARMKELELFKPRKTA